MTFTTVTVRGHLLMCGTDQVLAHVPVLPNGEASAAARSGATEAAGAADSIKQEARPGHAATACPWTLSRGFAESSSTEERRVGKSTAAPGLVCNESCSSTLAEPGQRDGLRPTEEKWAMHSAPSARASLELHARVRAMLGPYRTNTWQCARPLPSEHRKSGRKVSRWRFSTSAMLAYAQLLSSVSSLDTEGVEKLSTRARSPMVSVVSR